MLRSRPNHSRTLAQYGRTYNWNMSPVKAAGIRYIDTRQDNPDLYSMGYKNKFFLGYGYEDNAEKTAQKLLASGKKDVIIVKKSPGYGAAIEKSYEVWYK